MFNRKGKPATRAQMEYMGRVKLAGCVCCLQRSRITGLIVEFNHHLHAGKRIGADVGCGECQWHHRGVLLNGMNTADMTILFGPSRAKGSKPFHAEFGSDAALRVRSQLLAEKVDPA